MAFSSRFCASAVSISAACSAISCAGLVGSEVLAEELRHQTQAHRELVGLPVVHREDPMPVAGEIGELPHVVPHPLIGGVEQVRAVLVDLDPGLRLGLGIRVAADVRAPVDDEDTLAELSSHAFGDRQTEESGADDEEVKTSGHRLPRVSDLAAKTRFGGSRAPGIHAGFDQLGFPSTRRWPEAAPKVAPLVAIASRFDISHSSHTNHTRTIDRVGYLPCSIGRTTPTPHLVPFLRSSFEETSVPNRRRRKLSTAMSAVAALAVASPCAYFLVYESTTASTPPTRASRVQAGGQRGRPAR